MPVLLYIVGKSEGGGVEGVCDSGLEYLAESLPLMLLPPCLSTCSDPLIGEGI
jgi:hypothetical protein